MTHIKNGNSSKNQDIKARFVRQHVLCNVGQEVEFILQMEGYGTGGIEAPYSYDDITNIYQSDFDELVDFITSEMDNDEREEMLLGLGDFDEEIGRIEDWEEILTDQHTDGWITTEELQNYLETNHFYHPEPAEIYEWWKVSDFLCEKLEEQGHCVIPFAGIWGRQATGQAILLDYVITEICHDMEILEGQKYEWEVH